MRAFLYRINMYTAQFIHARESAMQLQVLVQRSTALATGQRITFAKTKADATSGWTDMLAGVYDLGKADTTMEWYTVTLETRKAEDLANDLNAMHAALEKGVEGMSALTGARLVNFLRISTDPGVQTEKPAAGRRKRQAAPKKPGRKPAKSKSNGKRDTSAAGIRLVPTTGNLSGEFTD